MGRPIAMRNAAGVQNLTARPVSLDQLSNMLRGSPVAPLVPDDDSTTPPLDVKIGTRTVRVQIGRRGEEVLVRLSKPEGAAPPVKTQPMAKVAEPSVRIKAPTKRPKAPSKGPAARPKPITARPKTATTSSTARSKTATAASRAKTTSVPPAARTKTPTLARTKTPSTASRAETKSVPPPVGAKSPATSRTKTPTTSRAKTASTPAATRAKTGTQRPKSPTRLPATRPKAPSKPPASFEVDLSTDPPVTRTKPPTKRPSGGIEIRTPSPAAVVTSKLSPVPPTRDLSPSGIFDALTLDDIDLMPAIAIPAPKPISSAGIVIPTIDERVEVDAPTHTSSPGIALPFDAVAAPRTRTNGTAVVTAAAPKATGQLAALVEAARARGASDLHIAAARITSIRVGGQLVPLDGSFLMAAAEVEGLLLPLLDREMRTALNRAGYVDFALEVAGGGRLRANICKQQQGLKATFRLALPSPLPLDKLGLPADLAKVVSHHQGLVVIAGPSGHGKTTTLAALVDLVNSTRPHHILTIEDPVEIVHPRKAAVISQREVGRHTSSFARGLKASLREDPDVIVIGELRDRESVEIALTAAETGHLVLATMSTPSAAKTIDRLIDMFPPEEHDQVRASVAGALRAIVAQRLLPKKGGGGVVPAVELVTGVLPLAVMIREDKMYQLPNLMQRGRAFGMIRLEDSVAELVRTGRIEDDAKTQLMWKVRT